MRRIWPDCAGAGSLGNSKLKVAKIGEAHFHTAIHGNAGDGSAKESVNETVARNPAQFLGVAKSN